MSTILSSEANNLSVPKPPRPLVKVGVIWALLAALFLVFNVIYWPAYRQQLLTHPASFVDYARTLPAEEARTVLRSGIAGFNPPCEAPYAMLADLEAQAGNHEAAALWTNRADYYRVTAARPVPAPALTALAETASRQFGGLSLPPDTQAALSRCALSLGNALGLDEAVSTMTPEQHLGLFALGGGTFSVNGEIGGTGVRAPLPLFVYSGGGMDERRGAHIFVGDVDHAEKQRGMHIVLLNADTGAVIRADLFDLWESPFEGERMLHFLNHAPDGCIGLFAVCDDGSAFMTGAVENGLMQFGIRAGTYVDREPKVLGLRYGFAAIGIKGAVPHSALQSWSPERFCGRRGHPVACAVLTGGEQP